MLKLRRQNSNLLQKFQINFEIFWCAARKRCGCIFRACDTQNSRRHRSSLLSRRNVWARKTRVRCRDRVNFPRKSSRNRCKYSAFLTRDAPQLQPPPLRKVQNRSAATGCVRCTFDGRKITRSAVHLRKICVDNIRIGCSIFSILARGAPQTRVILPILRCAKLLSSAQLSFESVQRLVTQNSCSAPRSRKKSRAKGREFVANFLSF